jgi:hypothetical protein
MPGLPLAISSVINEEESINISSSCTVEYWSKEVLDYQD